jgi:hypothetical protein
MQIPIHFPEEFKDSFSLVSCSYEPLSDTLSVYVQALRTMSAEERGKALLDLEDALCKEHPLVRIWHTPLGDKNSLRNLRGISLVK